MYINGPLFTFYILVADFYDHFIFENPFRNVKYLHKNKTAAKIKIIKMFHLEINLSYTMQKYCFRILKCKRERNACIDITLSCESYRVINVGSK